MKWGIIGAGPAGIAAVGKLLDAGVPPSEILWVDPNFKVGDFGQKWQRVSSNTTVELFLQFLYACDSFNYSKCPIDFKLNSLIIQDTCMLQEMVLPLQWISDLLRELVNCKQGMALELDFIHHQWQIKMEDEIFHVKNVILSIGAEPLSFPNPCTMNISIEQALDLNQLKTVCGKNDVIGVFGSSHTAIVALYNLIDLNVKKVINFYRSPLRYAKYMDGWILYDNTGLKGYSAKWAKENLDNNLLSNIERVHVLEDNFQAALNSCHKIISAIGFERRKLPLIHVCNPNHYNKNNGIIAPGLFGFGIAFPRGKFDRAGNYEYQVGLWKFMDYLTEILPVWLEDSV